VIEMLFNTTLELIAQETYETDDKGDRVPVKVRRKVYADKQSVRQSEHYEAAATGLRPELMFVVRSIDYKGEPKLEYGGKEYTIVRTYNTKSELTELVCQGVVNDGE